MKSFAQRLLSNQDGAMAVETALVSPLLILLSLGIFETGSIVARQHELQTAANEATIIVMAANQGPEIELSEVKTIIKDSINLGHDNITLSLEYRCNLQSGKVKEKGSCPSSADISSYVEMTISDTHTPTWTYFGVGGDINFYVERSIQVS